ncbi:MAG TPA: glycoside hydrolase family 92 protein, partial [Ferruginibacter sp.]|nr:glycoside hydrolase family 92 protein [Ferruginibacter sp.]
YRQKGFISNDNDHESASKTMEYAFDDWCIAQFAKATGNDAVYKKYMLRAQQYKNLFDPASGHIRGKVQGFWYSPFKATEVNNFYTEGNSWHYSFAAPQDISGLIKLYGSKANFAKKVNELFTTNEALSGREQADVTGLIGQYAQGNEPSHHMAYLFNYAGQAWRTQELVNKICKDFYKNDPDGLIGNEDCGQMSAWYVLSAMGFYPVTPGNGQYALGTPVFDEVIIRQENGKTFTIKANNRDDKNMYVQSMLLNNQVYNPTYLKHTDIEKGGTMVFEMGAAPNYTRGTKGGDIPVTSIDDNNFVAVPYFEMNSNKIKESLPVVLKHIDKGATIFYNIQKEKQNAGAFIKYTKPFNLLAAACVYFYAEKNGKRSPTVAQQFYKVVTDRTISIKSEAHPMYTAGGQEALIDGITGTVNWKTGEWQSYFAKDFEAVIAFKKQRKFSYMGIHVLQDVSPWIVYPKEVMFEISEDGIIYKPLITVANKFAKEEKEAQVQQLGAAVKATGKYIRIKAINGGVLPA